MAFARMMAHITYLSEQGMELKFGRERRAEGPMTMASDFEVEHYLDHQAEIFLARFDPLTYLYLSRVMDYFEPFAEHAGARRTRASWSSPSTATGASAPSTRAHIDARAARRSARDVRRHEVASPWGHDSFLMDVPDYHALVAEFLA